MSAWMVVVVTVLYIGAAIDLGIKGNWQMATVFAGYALANCGIIFAIK